MKPERDAAVKVHGYKATPRVSLPSICVKDRSLNGTDYAVLTALDSFWDAGKVAYPSVATIAKRIGASRRTAQRSLSKLHDAEYVTRVFRSKSNPNGRPDRFIDETSIYQPGPRLGRPRRIEDLPEWADAFVDENGVVKSGAPPNVLSLKFRLYHDHRRSRADS